MKMTHIYRSTKGWSISDRTVLYYSKFRHNVIYTISNDDYRILSLSHMIIDFGNTVVGHGDFFSNVINNYYVRTAFWTLLKSYKRVRETTLKYYILTGN